MKKILFIATAVLFLFASTVMADSIAGKVGITARGGASYIFNSEWTDYWIEDYALDKNNLKPDIPWAAGGGIMYGITDNLSVNFDVIYMQPTLEVSYPTWPKERDMGKFQTVDFSLGGQWRFMPKSKFVPYIGAGLDVLWNKASDDSHFWPITASLETDVTYGGHVSAGADFFITPNIALNAEVRGLYSTKGDVTFKDPGDSNDGQVIARYNPTNISGFVGIRFFFGGAQEAPAPIAVAPEPLPPPPPPPAPPVEEMKKEAEAAAVVEQKIIEKGRVTMNVEFDTGKAVVKPVYYKEIENVADVMKKYPDLQVVVEGHTDNVGGEKYNLKLSQKRAEAIKTVMVKNFNIESGRIKPKGFGYSKSIGDNKTKAGRQINRRVEAVVEYEYTVKK